MKWQKWRLKLTDQQVKQGKLVFVVDHEQGDSQLNIRALKIFENGALIDEDRHRGFVCAQPQDHIYTVDMPQHALGANYQVEIELLSSDSDKSAGSLYLKTPVE